MSFFWWHELQSFGGDHSFTGRVWQLSHLTEACLPNSGKSVLVWSNVTERQSRGVWQSAHAVPFRPLCASSRQARDSPSRRNCRSASSQYSASSPGFAPEAIYNS